MIKELDRRDIERILRSTTGHDLLPRYRDEGRWQGALRNRMLGLSPDQWMERAERDLKEPIVAVPASLYLTYSRTGNRAPHDGIIHARRSRLMSLVIGECLERKGRCMDAIMDHAWAICEETSWVIPAHSRTALPEYRDISWIDLVSAETARTLAEAAYIMGDRLDEHDPMIRQRIVHELDRRCWRPYVERDDLWWMFGGNRARVNNWTAVCNCGVVGSALLAMEDVERLTAVVRKGIRSMNFYLRSFDPDGGCDEGPAYWNYGMSNYAWLSYLLEARTEGRVSLMETPEMPGIAMFPQRATLSGQNVVNFSDCPPRVGFSASLMFYLGERLGLPQVSGFAQHQHDINPRAWGLRDIAWMPERPHQEGFRREMHVYFSGMQWMVSRSDPADDECLMLAAKGGNNGENHNQNDVGNFIAHLGGESLIVDLGSGSYTKDYFGPRRYEILVNSSWGHNVPLVNGYQQAPGPEHASRVLEHRSSEPEDVLDLELKDAYPVDAGIRSLRRRTSLHRGETGPWIEMADAVKLAGGPGQYKCPLYTWGNVSLDGDGVLRISGERAAIRVQFEPVHPRVAVQQVDLKDEKFPRKVRRAVIQMPIRRRSGELRLRIVPESLGGV